jgi:selenocysteine-specific elongation factor
MNAASPPDQPQIEMPFVIGTAGHVDHGKSTLVKALTGVDPDRLAEEREREMTIDLGFAALTLPDGRAVSIVDVPGHERFVRNMLAGAGGIDLALLVISADDGPMPQTREHLAILDLLGVEQGVVAVTRSDLVDEDWRDLVVEEARALIDGTSLEGSPVVAVSSLTGEGLDDLRAALTAGLDRAIARDASGAVRLPVDRSFHVAGFGTVVTGTLVGGQIHAGDELMLYPERRAVRVRGLQAHGQQVTTARAGTRVAVNLGGVDRSEVGRGHVAATPGSLTPSMRFDVRVRLLETSPVPIEQNDELIVFAGSAEVPARLTLLDREKIAPGDEGWVQLRLSRPATAMRGDRLILRRPSPAITVGGGVVIDPVAPRHRRMRPEVIATLEVLEQGTPEELIARALGEGVMDIGALARLVGVPDAERSVAGMVGRGELVALSAGDLSARAAVMQAFAFDRARTRASAFLTSYHAAHPLLPGARRDELGATLGIRSQRSLDDLVHALAGRGAIRVDGAIVALPDFSIQLTEEERRRADAFLAAARAEPYSPPPPAEFDIDDALLGALAVTGQVVRVSDQIAYPAEVFDAIRDGVLAWIEREGAITLAEYRDRFDTSRKYAQPTLEHLDELRVTRRKGDARVRFRGSGGAR